MSDRAVDDELDLDLAPEARPIVYLRKVGRGVRTSDGSDVPPDAYALHDETGQPLAIFPDRATARAAAKANEMNALSVH
ncbi:MAG: DUF1150 family protein [Pseudomonadota bacterium]